MYPADCCGKRWHVPRRLLRLTLICTPQAAAADVSLYPAGCCGRRWLISRRLLRPTLAYTPQTAAANVNLYPAGCCGRRPLPGADHTAARPHPYPTTAHSRALRSAQRSAGDSHQTRPPEPHVKQHTARLPRGFAKLALKQGGAGAPHRAGGTGGTSTMTARPRWLDSGRQARREAAQLPGRNATT